MKTKALLFIFIFTAVSLQAQDTLRQQRIISLNLLSYAGLYAPRWTAGYTQKISDRWWAGIDAGYGSPGFSVHGREGALLTSNYELFEIRPSVYYDLKPKSKVKYLLSAELFYINHKDHFANEWYHDKSAGLDYDYDSADYKRIKTGLNININAIIYLTRNFVLWPQMGIGIRNRSVSYSNVSNRRPAVPDDNDDNWNFFNTDGYIRKEGSYRGFNYNLEMKLAYIF